MKKPCAYNYIHKLLLLCTYISFYMNYGKGNPRMSTSPAEDSDLCLIVAKISCKLDGKAMSARGTF